jgi:uncharacterized membrane protein YoaK (UPF0700 family)
VQRYSGNLIAVAVALAALAGFVDAIAFSLLGFFASFMSGNSTRLGVALSGGEAGYAAIAAALVLAFVAGVIAASVIARIASKRRGTAVLGLVAVLLALAALLGGVAPARLDLLLAAAAMGAMNGVFAEGGEVTIGVTYMTGSLVKLGQRLAAALIGERDRWDWLPYFALWVGFVAGAVMGAGAYLRIGMDALWIAAGAAALLAIVTWLVPTDAP